MSEYVITINSTSDLPKEWVWEREIPVVPLNCTIGGKTYRDMYDLTAEEFYGMLENGEMAVTSQPSPQTAIDILEPILKKGKDIEVYEMVDAIKLLSEQKHTVYEYLDLFLVWFRDVLMFKATNQIDGLVFRQEYNDIKSRADVSSYEGLETIIKAIETAKQRLQANVNFDLTMELLFLTIREN